MGFSKPSKIQERALPLLLKDPPQHMIGQSQSGTGKTAAFVLTMLSRIDYNKNEPQAICLAPSRELARQIMSVVTTMGKFTKVIAEFAIPEQLPKDATRVSAHIIVGTPGTAVSLITRGVIKTSAVKIFVLDEADTMVDKLALGPQVLKVKRSLPTNCQLVLFSATFSDQVKAHVNNLAPGANKIELKRNEISVDTITQFYLDCKNEDAKYDALVGLYHLLTIGQSIIFCKAKKTADKIAERMTSEGHKVASLHGSKEAMDRDAVMDRFRDGQDKVLITTNVIARGIDIPQVNMVVNYDLPMMSERQQEPGVNDRLDLIPDVETYIHRIGRTGRFGRKGISVNFVHNQKSFQDMMTIQQATGKTITKVETGDYDMMDEQLRAILKKK
ncbi:DEAD-domain-containing protein [Thelephora ganbajun]|uniref:DEAD-domain-containing protein n=1 Tax=Thelephora ganbajun TaxID=370292 RepID=A0ACB6ZEG6_THEGA|nr:DEAD-domain-containing protein [Thelephora ganbajun]